MPGVLIIEAMAQTGGVMLLNSFLDPSSKLVVFMGINNAKFRKPVVPGDQLYIEAEMKQRKSRYFIFTAKAYVNETVVAEAELTAGIMDKENKTEE